jgi:CRP/FNR family transcriptional regulator, cyclic AMP receptor protein
MTASGDSELLSALTKHPFFEGFEAEFLRAIGVRANDRRFGVDELLAKEGTEADLFYAVLEGKVALEIGSGDRPVLTVQTVGPGEVVGWSWLVPPHRWRFDARALKPTHVVELDGDVVRRVLRQHPAWGFQFMVRFMPVLAERLENTRVQLLDIYAR